MSSRLRRRSLVTRLYECYIRFELPSIDTVNHDSLKQNGTSSDSSEPQPPSRPTPTVAFIHPPNYNDPEMVRAAAEFAFPLPTYDEHGSGYGYGVGYGLAEDTSSSVTSSASPSLFTFVLTSASSEWTFGYVRSSIGAGAGAGSSSSSTSTSTTTTTQTVAVFLTFLPYQELFFKALNRIVELGESGALEFLDEFSRSSQSSLPEPGSCFNVGPGNGFVVPIEDDRRLPEIPANRHLSEFFAALSPSSMLALFQSLLAERRIVVVSRRLGRLSSLCLASSLFLYPMHWQHIFIPCLPHHLVDYLSAPMPFIIGVHSSIWNTAEGGSCVVVDADADAVIAFEEDRFPPPVEHVLLEGFGSGGLGEGLARAFLRGLAMLMGHWQDAVLEGRFDDDMFTRLAHPAYRPYIRSKLLRLQIFRQFIEERVERLKNGGLESDEFEREAIEWRRSGGARLAMFGGSSHQNRTIRKAGQRVISSGKRVSNNFLDSVKHNSALKSALRTVKEGGKSVKQKSHGALSDIKSKFHVPLPLSVSRGSGGGGSGRYITGGGVVSHARQDSHEGPVQLAPLPTSLSTLSAPASSPVGPFLASSCSASTLNHVDTERRREWAWNSSSGSGGGAAAGPGGRHPKPRLSRSEENLIDLDSGANPLYELLNGGRSESGDVFEDGGWDDDALDITPPPLPVIPPPRRANRDSSTKRASGGPQSQSQNHSQSLGELLDLDLDAHTNIATTIYTSPVATDAKSMAMTMIGDQRSSGIGTDDLSLLSEYGLGTYFSNMNLQSNSNSNSANNSNRNSGTIATATKSNSGSNSNLSSTGIATTPSKPSWTTFE